MSTVLETAPRLIQSLLDSRAYPHSITRFEVLETHISWIILTGRFAYKIKKPVKLPFVDFSTLADREHFCREELELNRQWSPELYLEVVPIGGSCDHPVVGGDGVAIEYALKMREFPQEARLDNQLEKGLVNVADMCELAEHVADAHSRATVSDDDSVSAMQHIGARMLENFTPAAPYLEAQVATRLESWTKTQLDALAPILQHRHENGYVRECHGDLHLRNLVRLESGIAAFDCVEFSAELRTIDVMSDVAFLVMDLAARGRQDLGYAFLNRYLELTGDYAGIATLDLYVGYHCMIRAKVAAISAREHEVQGVTSDDRDEVEFYANVAIQWIDRPPPCLIAMYGYSGSGKTWLSSRLMRRLPAIRIRSDIERKRLHHLPETASSGSRVGLDLYTEGARGRVYDRLIRLSALIRRAGHNVIVDASHLDHRDRERLKASAKELGEAPIWVCTRAPEQTLIDRLRRRETDGAHVSEANEAVLRHQLATAAELTATEQARAVVVSGSSPAVDDVVSKIEQLQNH